MKIRQLLNRSCFVPLLIIAAGAVTPATASADLPVSSLTTTPDSTQAGAHTDFHLSLAFGGTERVKSLVIHLPPGLAGNPSAATPCPESDFLADACPATSQVGSTTVNATATGLGNQAIVASGPVYVLVPKAGQIALLGIKTFPTGPSALIGTPIHLESVVSVRTSSDNGLDSTLADIPNTAAISLLGVPMNTPIRIDSMELTLNAAGANGPFEGNPTSCNVATTRVDATSYDSEGTFSGAGSFTPTGCDKEAYGPTMVASASGATGALGRTAVKLGVLQADGQAASKRVSVTLPSNFHIELLNTTARACTSSQQLTGTCPEASKIGSAIAATPLLSVPLTGPVYLYASKTGLPVLSITLEPLGITVTGETGMDSKGRLVNTFDNLPDTGLSRFELTLNGGPGGVLQTSTDLCTGSPTAEGSFVGQNGASATATAPITVADCKAPVPTTGRPKVTAAVHRFGTRKATLKVKVKRAVGGPALRTIQITLPKGVSVAKLGARTFSVSPKAATKVRRTSSHVIRVTLSAKDAAASTLTIKGGALKASRHASRKLKVRVTDADSKSTTKTVTAARR